MIICFSGVGNTRQVADHIQEILGDEILRLPPGRMRDPSRATIEVPDGRLIWMFPVYGWGLPYTVEKVLRLATVKSDKPVVHHLICTCGDDIGYTDRQWHSIVKQRGWQSGSAFSVQMPNTYTFMPGFDVDTMDVSEAKLAAMPERVNAIAEVIDRGDCTVVDVVRGSWPWVKSNILRKWFNRHKLSLKPFHATDACNGCGRCARNCPLGCIEMVDGHPKWSGTICTMCARCYHMCPQHAVAYGKATDGKGQYVNPVFKTKK